MKKFIRFIIIYLIISQFSHLYAQDILYSHSKDEVQNVNQEEQIANRQDKIQYKLNTGTSVTLSNFGNAMHIFAEPELRYRLSPKFSFSTGLLFINTTVSDLYSENFKSNSNFTNTFITASVDYNATDRLRISGEILYGMNRLPTQWAEVQIILITI